MDSQRDSQVAVVTGPKAESQVADAAGPKTEPQVADAGGPKAEPQVADAAGPKAESQGDSAVGDVAAPAEAEMATQKVILSRLALMDVPASDWNNRMRDVSIKLSSKIPYVGQAASIILGIFWPVDSVNIFESLKQDIENLVDAKILAKEMEERQSEIDAIHKIIEEYEAAQTTEKRGWLTRWIADSIALNVKLQKSSNNIHFILPAITVALLHLSALRERLDFGKEVYGEDNIVVWKNELEQTYHDYVVVFFPDIYKDWKVWRADQVVIERWLTQHVITLPPFYTDKSHATVEDKVSGVKREYCEDWSASLSIFKTITNDHKTKMCNDAYTEMAGCISTTFVFDKIVPSSQDPPYDKELFGCMFLGPYAEDLLLGPSTQGEPSYRRSIDHDDFDVINGPLTEMVIREWNTIDAMQFIYTNGSGTLAGNPHGGQEHRLDFGNKYVDGLSMGFSNGLLCSVQVLYRDGTKSDRFGNRGGWQTADGVANAPPGYKLRSWSYGVNNGPSFTSGPGTLQLQYEIQL